jgi:ATP-dependent exoDNAse (exonuclease V) beta subunit
VCAPGDASAAVGFESGVIDLVFTDARTAEIVVVDYKTDAVRTREEALERSRAYEAQARTYPRALRMALELDRDPRFELWFLQADCAIEPLAELRSSPRE